MARARKSVHTCSFCMCVCERECATAQPHPPTHPPTHTHHFKARHSALPCDHVRRPEFVVWKEPVE